MSSTIAARTALGGAPSPDRVASYAGGPAPRPRTLVDILHATAAAYPTAPAIDDGRRVLDYAALLTAVERLAVRLDACGVGCGDRVGVRVPSGTADLYVAILAVLSVGAAYVPVDVDDPPGRVALVCDEAGVCAVVGGTHKITPGWVAPGGGGAARPAPSDDAWVIFTSGSTGKPKGVAVRHRNAAAFVDAEAGLFLRGRPLGPGDRVLAGLSVAFDASCEEMWLAWRHGACLVPAARSLVRSGPDLGDWLVAQQISVVSTVPTLASLLHADHLRHVRLLILGGEACPAELVTRLADGRREVWNTYGPTETTVVALAAPLVAGEPVRIGLPLDGWQVAAVDRRSGEPVGWGEVGELVINGAGTARYLDAEKDAAVFRPLPALGWERAYYTGDLVRADPEGLGFVGRADAQVKIRGYRVEPSEIESVLLELDGIEQAAVTTHERHPGLVELVAYYRCDGGGHVDRQRVHRWLRGRLPAHMVPAYLEELAVMPVLTSGKVDRARLPRPAVGRCLTDQRAHVAASTATETALAEALGEVLDTGPVSVDAHVVDDLGADSLLLAHFCGLVRRQGRVPAPSMEDVYRHPTIRDLAAVLDRREPVTEEQPQAPSPATPRPVGTAGYFLCGALQLLIMLGAIVVGTLGLVAGMRWVWPATGFVDLYLRSVAFGAAVFLVLTLVPVLAKWVVIGRWRPQEIRVWSLAYVRVWLVRALLRASPMALFRGSPLLLLYLRALGARIGRGVLIVPRVLPVCTDLLTVGDGTVVCKDALLPGYRVDAGVLRTGPITLGRDVFVGEGTVLDIDTSMGDGAQLGHSSALHPAQAVPAGERWHGSPARRTDVDYRRVRPARCGTLRRAGFATVQLLNLLLLAPLLVAGVLLVAKHVDVVVRLVGPGPLVVTDGTFYLQQLAFSSALFLGGAVLGLAVVSTVPRLLVRVVRPGRVYPLYGLHYWLHRTVARLTNVSFYVNLFGDSSYILGYLRAVGYRIGRGGNTGSNFGAAQKHETPYLCSIGTGTVISDGISFLSAEFSNTSFRTSEVVIGADNFFGNGVTYPAGGRIGDGCLVATKAMIPLDGPLRDNVGLLGSPCFEMPRSRPDSRFDLSRVEFRRRLAAKNRHNIATMALFLLVGWIWLLATLVIAGWALDLYDRFGAAAIAVGMVVEVVSSFAYSVLIERVVTRFRRMRPRYCSIYDPYFWWHERFWKLSTQPGVLNGTPFKSLTWRLLGAQMGRRVFDDGCSMTEKSLVSVGDHGTLNAGTVLQAHSMEDGIFKSAHITLGAGVTLAPGAFVHYDVRIGDGATLDTDAFLMKGEEVPPGAHWTGNPAHDVRAEEPHRCSPHRDVVTPGR